VSLLPHFRSKHTQKEAHPPLGCLAQSTLRHPNLLSLPSATGPLDPNVARDSDMKRAGGGGDARRGPRRWRDCIRPTPRRWCGPLARPHPSSVFQKGDWESKNPPQRSRGHLNYACPFICAPTPAPRSDATAIHSTPMQWKIRRNIDFCIKIIFCGA